MITCQAENKFADEEDQYQRIEGTHPPDRRGQARAEHVVDHHRDRVADLKQDDGKSRQQHSNRQQCYPQAETVKNLDPEYVTKRADNSQSGTGTYEKIYMTISSPQGCSRVTP